MKKLQKILSLALVLLLVTSITVPAASAQMFHVIPAIAGAAVAAGGSAAAAPTTVGVAIGGSTVLVGGATLVKIGEHLGIKWDGIAENFNNFASSVGKKLSNIISGGEWVDATSSEADALLAFDYYTATSGSGGKKDDKLYHKAKWKNGKVKINTESISEKDAVKELKKGRDIFTAKKELAENLVNRVSKENYDVKPNKFKEKNGFEKLREDEIEIHHAGKEGYYEHCHPKYQHTRPHCWFWRR